MFNVACKYLSSQALGWLFRLGTALSVSRKAAHTHCEVQIKDVKYTVTVASLPIQGCYKGIKYL